MDQLEERVEALEKQLASLLLVINQLFGFTIDWESLSGIDDTASSE